ncbi:prolyl-tRNA synthetase [Candidatus Wolfebacteria bacterium]|nr:prolyl-tRNA synthetase [Candidatus Wolfebacteria bacterium]
MRQSELFIKTKKEAPKDEEAINSKLLIRGGFIDKSMAGVYTFLPLGLKVIKKIENIIREEMIKIGGQEILMPALQSKSDWLKTGRWDSYDALFKFTSYYSKNDYALGPTHEEVVSPLMKNFIFSYKDLPFYIFQIQNKFRDEVRVKSGLLRTKEFLMKDLYSFHCDEKSLDKYYEKIVAAYWNIFKKTGIKSYTYFTFASGGSFSKYSHEFQTLTPAGEDIIYICEKCQMAINKEIIKKEKSCPQCGGKKFKEEKAVETGNIFKLKSKYSAPFKLKYKDKNGKEKDVIMGCYGIGLGRLMGAVVEVCNDKKGIIWPEAIAPYRAHLINLEKSVKNNKFAEEIYKHLQKSAIEVIYDDREEKGPGEKLVEADLIGIPYRLIISGKNGNKIEIRKRSEEKVKLIDKKELVKLLKKNNV